MSAIPPSFLNLATLCMGISILARLRMKKDRLRMKKPGNHGDFLETNYMS